MIPYRSIASLNKDIMAWIEKLPRDIELVVGIPRSGLLVANLLSLHMNIPLTDVEGLINGRIIQTGVRYNGDKKEVLSSAKKILVVDDSVLRGTQMRAVRTKIEESKIPHQILYSAVYVNPGSQNMVDYFYELLTTPRFFEWNIMHTPIVKEFCIDIDGVLCRDPTKEENDDGPRYEEFIKSVRPISIPSYRIGWLVTCRLRKYRSITEEWLEKHNFKYQELVMMDFPTKEARIASGTYAKYKANIYQQANAKLFIESSKKVAIQIAELSGRPVFCAATREMVYPGFASKNYQRGRRFAKLLWRNPRVAFRRLVRPKTLILMRKILRRLKTVALILKARREISHLYREPNISSKSVACALKDTIANKITPEEKSWIDRIESLRKELNSSSTEISVVDYGAGSPDAKLKEEEMYEGRIGNRTIGDVCRKGSKPYLWTLALFKLIREFKPAMCLELGTCLGISASYEAAALKLNQLGEIVTLEGAESFASLAEQNFQRLGLDNVRVVVGRFQDTLQKVLNEKTPVDYAFIDGHHDEKATLAYFEQILPFLSGKAVLVFDDISWSEGMKRAWNVIDADQRVNVSVDLFSLGICIIDTAIKGKKSFKISLVEASRRITSH